MREIKFRAWDKEQKRWIKLEHKSGLLFSWGQIYLSDSYDGEDNPTFKKQDKDSFELMQYTGLKDKNGKEIYEGDILEAERENACQWEVVWFNGWYLDRYVNGVKDEGDDKYGFRTDLKVIGNIYENPELLK